MKKKFLLPVVFALIFGYLCANYVLALYEDENTTTVNTVYFLQIAAYKNFESSIDEFKDITNKITVSEDDKYYTYIGITTSLIEANRVKNIYKENNIEVYIKEKNIDNYDFIMELEQYDVLLKNSKTFKEINSLFETVLATYEERALTDL